MTHLHMSIQLFFFKFSSQLGYYRVLSRVPCAVRFGYLFYFIYIYLFKTLRWLISILCLFQVYSEVIQLYIYIHIYKYI